MFDEAPLIGVPIGDPAGIGSEIALEAVASRNGPERYVIVGDGETIKSASRSTGVDATIDTYPSIEEVGFSEGSVTVIDLDNATGVEYGAISERSGRATLGYLERAVSLAESGEVDGIAMGPITDEAIDRAADTTFGEWIAGRLDTDVSILMTMDELTVSHVTSHLSLREACEAVTEESVTDTIHTTAETLSRLGLPEATIAVAGLNPHASEDGLLGDEEASEIGPAIERARRAGIDAVGPEPPDTVFAAARRGAFDCVVAMYHDQGHIAFKTLAFREDGVEGAAVLAGTPFPYTTTNHGSALDIAGTGAATIESMEESLYTAALMCTQG